MIKINTNVQAIQYPPISEVREWLDQASPRPRPLLDLCQAVPDYPPHPELLQHLSAALRSDGIARYTPDEGLPEVREAVAAWLGRRYGAGPDAEQVCLSIGASQAFWLAMTVLCRAGDQVIVQTPAYFDHPMGLQALGIEPVFAPYSPDAPEPDPEQLERLITPATRALLLVTPSNPTGHQIAPATLERLFELCSEHGIALVLDETYHAFADGIPHRLFTRPDWSQTLVQIVSFGKTFSLTGFRAGALVAGNEVLRQALKVQDSMAVCQPRLTQLAVQYGCEHLDRWVAEQAAMMQQRHSRFVQLFDTAGSAFSRVSSGGFFAWVRHPWPQLNSRQAARRLLEDADLVTLPGAAFGPGLDSYLRLAFGNIGVETLPEAVTRLARLSC